MTFHVATRALLAIREEMERKGISQADIAGQLQWLPARTSKVLHGKLPLTVDDLEALCFAVGLSPTEAVRDRGLEFCADMTPTELRILERLRQLPHLLDAIAQILQVNLHTRAQERRAVPKKRNNG